MLYNIVNKEKEIKMEKAEIITEEIGFYSPYATLDEALTQFNSRGRQMVCDFEPSEVIVRCWNDDDGSTSLYHAHQVYVRVRYTPRGKWQPGLLTFGMDRYGTKER